VIASSANEQKAMIHPGLIKVTYISFDLEQFNQTINYYHFLKHLI